MASTPHLSWFRDRLRETAATEPTGLETLLAWRDRRAAAPFSARLIPLADCRGWSVDGDGNIRHETGAFFSIEGVRTEAGSLREVASWDQPIFNQTEGGVLALIARDSGDGGVEFLLQGQLAPGNIGKAQFAPTVQSTWSNIKRAHGGQAPAFADLIFAETGIRLVYSAAHNEEGGKFWLKSNDNRIVFVENGAALEWNEDAFIWASLSQIKALALMDELLNPYVKSIIAPL